MAFNYQPASQSLPDAGISAICIYNISGISFTWRTHDSSKTFKKELVKSYGYNNFDIKADGLLKRGYKNGEAVKSVDLNDGFPADDFTFNQKNWFHGNSLTYKPSTWSTTVKVVDFEKNTYSTRFTDADGVAGRTHNTAFIQKVLDDTLYIFITSPHTEGELPPLSTGQSA